MCFWDNDHMKVSLAIQIFWITDKEFLLSIAEVSLSRNLKFFVISGCLKIS